MSDDNVKKRPSDSSEIIEETEEGENGQSSDNAYFSDLEELEKARKEREERKKEELERLRKEHAIKKKDNGKDESQEETSENGTVKIEGQSVSRKPKEFSTEKKLFRHNKMFGFSGSGAIKIDKVLKKAHVNTEKRRNLIEALSAYNPSKSLLKKKDFELFARKFKSKNFSGNRFREGSKTVDFKSLRKEFSKKDLNKFRQAITGETDTHKYQTKTAFAKTGRPDRKPSTPKH